MDGKVAYAFLVAAGLMATASAQTPYLVEGIVPVFQGQIYNGAEVLLQGAQPVSPVRDCFIYNTDTGAVLTGRVVFGTDVANAGPELEYCCRREAVWSSNDAACEINICGITSFKDNGIISSSLNGEPCFQYCVDVGSDDNPGFPVISVGPSVPPSGEVYQYTFASFEPNVGSVIPVQSGWTINYQDAGTDLTAMCRQKGFVNADGLCEYSCGFETDTFFAGDLPPVEDALCYAECVLNRSQCSDDTLNDCDTGNGRGICKDTIDGYTCECTTGNVGDGFRCVPLGFQSVIDNVSGSSTFGGAALEGTGDVNGDGFDDFAVSTGANAIYVIFGAWAPFDAVQRQLSVLIAEGRAFKISGDATYPIGALRTIARAGDFNGDGIDDFLIGSPTHNGNRGAVHVVFGHTGAWSDSLISAHLLLATGAGAGNQLGASVGNAGFANADQYSDVLIGAPGSAAAYLIFGSAAPTAVSFPLGASGITYSGSGSGGNFGSCVGGQEFNTIYGNRVVVGATTRGTNGQTFSSITPLTAGLGASVQTGPSTTSALGTACAAAHFSGAAGSDYAFSAPAYQNTGRVYFFTPANSGFSLSQNSAGSFGAVISVANVANTTTQAYLVSNLRNVWIIFEAFGGGNTIFSNVATANFGGRASVIVSGFNTFLGSIASNTDFNTDGYDDIIFGFTSATNNGVAIMYGRERSLFGPTLTF